MSINGFKYICCCWLLSFSTLILAQQEVDTSLVPQIKNPYFKIDKGPTVYIDELHHNFHTKEERFKPFCTLLQRDGYRVKALKRYDDLQPSDVLIISNAINETNVGNWQQPIYDAFNEKEIVFLKNWVENGGRLLLIADHMPFAGAVNSLAKAFGFEFCNGFAQLSKTGNESDVFSTENRRLVTSVLTNGSFGVPIQSVTTFTGSSFQIPPEAQGVLRFLKTDECLQPEIAWQFDEKTTTKHLENSFQGAILSTGKGKIAVFGEAAQFTAQTVTREGHTFFVGFNSETAPHNIEFVRNLMLWLGAK